MTQTTNQDVDTSVQSTEEQVTAKTRCGECDLVKEREIQDDISIEPMVECDRCGHRGPAIPYGDDPLEWLISEVTISAGLRVVDFDDNENWQWIEVKVLGDVAGESEHLSNLARQNGFRFLGLDDEPRIVRFNRKKEQ